MEASNREDPSASEAVATADLAHAADPAADRSNVPPVWLVVLVVGIGLAMRFWTLASPLGEADSDEAVVGLMAGQFLEGDFDTFFWGSNYGGTIDQILTAGVFALVGPSVAALKLVQVALAAGACLLTWRVGRRVVSEASARTAALLFWIAPAAYVLFSTKSRGWHWLGLCLALGIVLTCLKLVDRPRWQEASMLGLLLGLAFWTSPALGFLVLPAVAYAVARRPRLLALAWTALPAFLIGAAPWIRYNLSNGFVSLEQLPVPVQTTYLGRLAGFFTEALPMALGLKVPYSHAWIAGPVAVVLYGLALLGLAVLLAGRPPRLAPLLVLAVAYPLLFAATSSSFYVNEPRYLLYLAPVIALLVAIPLTSPRRQVAALAVAACLSVAGLASLVTWAGDHPDNYDLAAGELDLVISVLDQRGIETAWADYWTAYRLTFLTDEAVVAASVDYVRHLPYQQVVGASPEVAYVVHRATGPDQRLGGALADLGIEFERIDAGAFAVYLPDEPRHPSTLPGVFGS